MSAVIAGALCVVVTLVNLLSLALAARRLKPTRAPLSAPPGAPPISVVRPLRGIEAFSEETLASGFRLDYPAFEMIFGVADADDPVIPLVERLRAAHPGVPSRLIVGDVAVSANPKLNNVVRGWEEARHDDVVLADSNVLMPPDYLQRLLAGRRPDAGLVCSTPVGSRPEGFAAEVECAFLNALQARWQYAGEAIGLGFAQGKSMLWDKPFLEARGGLKALGAEIAEDAAATKLVRAAGRRVRLVDDPFEQPLGRRALAEVLQRQFRWARLRRVTFPLMFPPEVFIGAVLPAGLGAYAAAASAGPWWGAAAFVGVLALWYGPEALLARRMGWFLSWRTPLAMLARDALFPFVWATAYVSKSVVWRGNAMTIAAGNPTPAPVPAAPLRQRGRPL